MVSSSTEALTTIPGAATRVCRMQSSTRRVAMAPDAIDLPGCRHRRTVAHDAVVEDAPSSLKQRMTTPEPYLVRTASPGDIDTMAAVISESVFSGAASNSSYQHRLLLVEGKKVRVCTAEQVH